MAQDIKTRFQTALNFIKNSSSETELSNKQKLDFYGLFKQATEGPCKVPAPSRLRIVERAKWEAWKNLGNITKEEAMNKYIEELTKTSPNWEKPSPKL